MRLLLLACWLRGKALPSRRAREPGPIVFDAAEHILLALTSIYLQVNIYISQQTKNINRSLSWMHDVFRRIDSHQTLMI